MKLLGYLLAIAAAVTWGLVYALDQKILKVTPPIVLLFIHSLVATVLMLPFVLFETAPFSATLAAGRNHLLLLLSAIALATLASFLIFGSIKILGASHASILEISYPFFVVLFSFILFRNTLPPAFYVGGGLILIGSFIIIRLG